MSFMHKGQRVTVAEYAEIRAEEIRAEDARPVVRRGFMCQQVGEWFIRAQAPSKWRLASQQWPATEESVTRYAPLVAAEADRVVKEFGKLERSRLRRIPGVSIRYVDGSTLEIVCGPDRH